MATRLVTGTPQEALIPAAVLSCCLELEPLCLPMAGLSPRCSPRAAAVAPHWRCCLHGTTFLPTELDRLGVGAGRAEVALSVAGGSPAPQGAAGLSALGRGLRVPVLTGAVFCRAPRVSVQRAEA